MAISGKNESKLQKAVLSCDVFTTGYFAMFLLFFVPYVMTVCGTLVLWFLPIACLLPFVTLPLFYSFVHRTDTLLFGRYHLVMPLSGFISALFFVVAFSASSGGAGSVCAVFFGAVVFVSSVMIYRYCSFSVRARLLSEDITAASPYSVGITFAGCVAALITFFGFMYYDGATAYINTAYVFAGACAVITLIQYLATYYNIPKLSGRRVQSVKNVFRAFYSGLDRRMYFSALLFGAAFAVLAATETYMAIAFGLGIARSAAVAGVCVLCFAACDGICVAFVKQRSKMLSVISLCGYAVAAALIVVSVCVPLDGKALYAAITVSAGVTGACGALSVRQTKLRFLTIKPRITSGVVFILLQLTACAAQAVATLVCAAQAFALERAGTALVFIGGGAVAAALAVAAFVCAGKKRAKTQAAPGLSYEPNTSELDGGAEYANAVDRDETNN